jgi:chaperone required for assembly of F1-ATPase
MKRFWENASVVHENGRHAIRLDGRPMRLPSGPILWLESSALAAAIADEWQATGSDFTVDDVPLTRLAGTAQERVAPDPAASVEALSRYAQNDLLCYRAESPEALVLRQARLWQPWLDRARARYGAHLRVTAGVIPVAQPSEAVSALRAALAAYPAFALAGLGILVPATGSLVLGLAVAEGALEAEAAFELACLDELFQAEQWGQEREATKQRRSVKEDIDLAARFMRLSR